MYKYESSLCLLDSVSSKSNNGIFVLQMITICSIRTYLLSIRATMEKKDQAHITKRIPKVSNEICILITLDLHYLMYANRLSPLEICATFSSNQK